jgi:hypothetical protein
MPAFGPHPSQFSQFNSSPGDAIQASGGDSPEYNEITLPEGFVLNGDTWEFVPAIEQAVYLAAGDATGVGSGAEITLHPGPGTYGSGEMILAAGDGALIHLSSTVGFVFNDGTLYIGNAAGPTINNDNDVLEIIGCSGGGIGQDVGIWGGNGTDTDTNGGSIQLTGGLCNGGGTSGSILLAGGDATTDGEGGAVQISAGDGGSAGGVQINGGNAVGPGDLDGGTITLTPGNRTGSGEAGYTLLSGRAGIGAAPQATEFFRILGGSGPYPDMFIRGGTSGTTTIQAGQDGTITLLGGQPTSGTATGGTVTVRGGPGGSTSGDGGDVEILGGTVTSGNVGSILVQGFGVLLQGDQAIVGINDGGSNEVEISGDFFTLDVNYIQLAPNGPRVVTGTGSPEGVVTAPIGSVYHRDDGGTGTSLYIKESGAGNTGWVAVEPSEVTLFQDLDTNAGIAAVADGHSYSMPANTLDEDGEYLDIEAWGTTASSPDLTVALSFGSDDLITFAITNAGSWMAKARVYRLDVSTEKSIAEKLTNPGSYTQLQSIPTQALNGTVTIRTRVSAFTAGTCDFEGLRITRHPAV